MIKAVGRHRDGRPLVILGLSHENLARLVADEPIVVDLAADPPAGIGLPGGCHIAIVAGRTEEDIGAQLRSASGNRKGATDG